MTTSPTDAGCDAAHEAALAVPDDPLPEGPWGDWTADTMDRFAGACR